MGDKRLHVPLLKLPLVKFFEEVSFFLRKLTVEALDVPIAVREVMLEGSPADAVDFGVVTQLVRLVFGVNGAVGVFLVGLMLHDWDEAGLLDVFLLLYSWTWHVFFLLHSWTWRVFLLLE